MTGTLTVTSGDEAAGLTRRPRSAGQATRPRQPGGRQMIATDNDQMSQAMNDSIPEYPAETEGVGNQVLEPTVRADGARSSS